MQQTTPIPLIRTICLIVLVGLNLRPSMAAIGPLVESIRRDVGLSFTQVSLLTTLPVIAMGLGCFVSATMTKRIGFNGVVTIALVVIALSDALHWFDLGFIGLLVAALGAGIGIALIQAVLPAFIKHSAGEKTPLLMGFYIAAIMGGAALSSAISPMVSHYLGWESALAIWGILAFSGVVVWGMRTRVLPPPSQSRGAHVNFSDMARLPRFWSLAIFFGLGTAGYTCLLAWIPPTFTNLGWTETHAGLALSWLTAIQVIAGLVFPALAQRMGDRRPVLTLVLLLSVGGFVLLGMAPATTAWLATALLGLGIGGLFPLSLIITMDHADEPTLAGQLAAWVQGIGYLIASASPVVAGLLKDLMGGFEQAWLLLGAIFLGLVVMCLRFDKSQATQHLRTVSD
ncbi:MFS transporter [Chromohalobacter beijerinckii]|uniref:MFS transporter n=1 Tax=Chromohalobacter beijerinckii TaxID=86179 RepID=A0ABV8XJK3_9GAMM|nr:MFS transporter [Chromohalobacter beijerinckii]MCK0764322.1 MFS transporter [Chromohalobacter beijerinckii]